MSHWQPFSINGSPNDDAWNLRRVVHLHRRAAWGATWPELEIGVRDGIHASVDRLTNPATTLLHPRTLEIAESAMTRNSVSLLKAAWVNEMWHGSDPLGEQLTLMWHNHFATGFQKVKDCRAMFDQYLKFRKHARSSFHDLVRAMVRDRAMLIWLDGDSNRQGHPNENFARELMELFTLGEGNYSESDVREAARALTGWTARGGEIRFDTNGHDAERKQILGRTDAYDADSLVDLLVSQPATASRIAWRICDHFLGRDRVPDDAIEALAQSLRDSQLNVGKAVEQLIRSSLFFDESQLGARFTSPASFVVSNLRSLELHAVTDGPAIIPEVAAAWMRNMGQDLFQPPGVSGWPGGSSWISAATMIDRTRFAVNIAQGTLHARAPRGDLSALAKRYDEDPVSFPAKLLFGSRERSAEIVSLPQLLTSTLAQFD